MRPQPTLLALATVGILLWSLPAAAQIAPRVPPRIPIGPGMRIQPLQPGPAGAAPTGVTLAAITPVSATLSWNAILGATGYRVLRAPAPAGPYGQVTAAPLTGTTFTDATLTPASTYYWTVSAEYSSAGPGVSAAVSGTTPAARNPSTFTATVPYSLGDTGKIVLTWEPVPGASYYWLQGQDASGNTLPPQRVAGTTFSHVAPPYAIQTYSLIAYFQRSDGQVFGDEANPAHAQGVPLPSHRGAWLSLPARNGPSSGSETSAYYATIGATSNKNTFGRWLAANGFGSGGEARARYFNAQDLNLGRDTQCRITAAGTLACYQANSGPKPGDPNFPSAETALNDLVAGRPAFAMVAMDVVNGEVQFYVYGSDSSLILAAALDDEGAKFAPQVCTSCHGGRYDATTHQLTNASFLPFDVSGFRFARAPGFSLADQEEAFRRLNVMVRASGPNRLNAHDPIVAIIDGWYGSNVNAPGRTQDQNYVPPGWAGQPNVYDVFKRTCRTCHLAVADTSIDFTAYQQVAAYKVRVQNATCSARVMPHAEPAFRKFWLDLIPYHPGYYEDASVLGLTCKP